MRNASWIMKSSLSAAVLSLALAGCGGQSSTPDNSTGTTSGTATDNSTAPQTNTASTKTASAASFKDAAATWQQVTAAKANLDNIIKAKKLAAVHEAAFKVRDIVKTLPGKSSALSPDKQKTLASQVKNVAQLADLLDQAGDSNNLKDTQENQAGMNDALDIIKGLYPAGALGA